MYNYDDHHSSNYKHIYPIVKAPNNGLFHAFTTEETCNVNTAAFSKWCGFVVTETEYFTLTKFLLANMFNCGECVNNYSRHCLVCFDRKRVVAETKRLPMLTLDVELYKRYLLPSHWKYIRGLRDR